AAETHLKERLEGGEFESIAPSGSTHSEYEIQQSEIEAANKRVLTLQAEENQKEEELNRKAAELDHEFAKQKTDEARPSSLLNEMDRNQLTPKQTLDPSAPPPETHPSHLQTQTLDSCTPPPETHPGHLQPPQTPYPSATAFTSSQSPQRPISDPDLSDHGLSSQGHPAQFPWQKTSKPVLNRYNPNTYQLHTQLRPPVLDSMIHLRQPPRIPYTWQPSPAAPSSKNPDFTQ
ncbi:Hypothetical predicted protein, partial [Paramuricea clavata]